MESQIAPQCPRDPAPNWHGPTLQTLVNFQSCLLPCFWRELGRTITEMISMQNGTSRLCSRTLSIRTAEAILSNYKLKKSHWPFCQWKMNLSHYFKCIIQKYFNQAIRTEDLNITRWKFEYYFCLKDTVELLFNLFISSQSFSSLHLLVFPWLKHEAMDRC